MERFPSNLEPGTCMPGSSFVTNPLGLVTNVCLYVTQETNIPGQLVWVRWLSAGSDQPAIQAKAFHCNWLIECCPGIQFKTQQGGTWGF
tara:strand:- start:110 stop:376 length:267 start_codon:yes stop_codon:yes gene_type:complete